MGNRKTEHFGAFTSSFPKSDCMVRFIAEFAVDPYFFEEITPADPVTCPTDATNVIK